MKIIGLFLLSLFFYSGIYAQSLTVQQYIDTYKDIAIREMKRAGVPASIILAQGLLETENGNSDLVLKSNNHFGIKCKSTWTGESVYHNDDEKGECFRKYNNADESFRDHSDFLSSSARYASLFRLEASDYKGWAYGLKNAGYATNPKYPAILIRSIERYNLQQYTLEGLSGKELFDDGKYMDEEKHEQSVSIVPVNVVSENPPLTGMKTTYNGIDAVYAARETSLLAIATQYDIALSKLLEYNDLDTDGLLPEPQWIYLKKKPKEGRGDVYVCATNESLHSISQNNAIQLKQLQQYNNLQGNPLLRAGTRVKLKQGTEITKVDKEITNLPIKEVSDKVKVHEVLPREGLYAISKKYNISVQEIRDWNNLTSDNLRVGQQLIISK